MNHETIILQLMQTEGVGARTLSRLLGVLSSEELELEDLFSADSTELFERCKLPGDFADRVGTDFEEAERLRRAPRVRAQQEARRIADRLSTRLEALRLSETRRSFLDYNPQPHSPLAEGPADPMIWAHFQMDGRGRLTLPTLTPGPDAERGGGGCQQGVC